MPRRTDQIYQRVRTAVATDSAEGLPIPKRNKVQPALTPVRSGRNDFVDQAIKLVERAESQAEPVPFQQYWPTYEAMDAAQQQWYFFWRAQLRQGNRLPADLSYLFVHIYEVINMVGFQTPQDAFRHLADFWRFYRLLQPKLDRYLPDWIADFIVLHELAPDALGWYSEVARITKIKQADFAIEAWINSGAGFDALANETLFGLANYNPTKSKFYKQFAASVDLDSAYTQGLTAVDDAMRKLSGKSLFEACRSPQRRVIRRTPFSSALHAYPMTEIEVASVHNWADNPKLAGLLNNILKHSETIVRQQNGYGYKLRNIQLDQRWLSAIERALEPETPKVELAIDDESLEQISKDSAAIRERLLAETETRSSEAVPPAAPVEPPVDEQMLAAAQWLPEAADVPESKRVASASIDWSRIGQRRLARARFRRQLISSNGQLKQVTPSTDAIISAAKMAADDTVAVSAAADPAAESGFLQRPDDTPADLLTDLAEVSQILGAGESKASHLIAVLMQNDWTCAEDALQSAFPGEFISVYIDEINSRALDEIGDNLLYDEDGFWVVLEDYRDEIEYILEHPEYLSI